MLVVMQWESGALLGAPSREGAPGAGHPRTKRWVHIIEYPVHDLFSKSGLDIGPIIVILCNENSEAHSFAINHGYTAAIIE